MIRVGEHGPGEWGNERAAHPALEQRESGRLRRTFRVEPNVPVSSPCPLGRQEPVSIFCRTCIHTAIRRGQSLKKTSIRMCPRNAHLYYFLCNIMLPIVVGILLSKLYSCQGPLRHSRHSSSQPRHFALFNRRLAASPASRAQPDRRRSRKRDTPLSASESQTGDALALDLRTASRSYCSWALAPECYYCAYGIILIAYPITPTLPSARFRCSSFCSF